MSYSVLMSVYYKEKAENLREAMMSIYNQTAPCGDFVLVCDGPLTDELDDIIDEMKALFKDVLQVVRLSENMGLGKALNEGIQHCRYELVGRMDSDDISHPDRFEKQLRVFEYKHPDIVSATVEEFSESPDKIEARRMLPAEHEDILVFAKKRNPFNHPCVMYKKSAVEAAGGYQDFYLLEDYFLWIRMLQNGAKGYNIKEGLLSMRAGSDMYRRRSGSKYAASQRKLFAYMKESGFISAADYVSSCCIRTASSMAPNVLREGLFKKILRK